MNTLRRWCGGIALVLLPALPLPARLVFEKTVLLVKATAEDRVLTATFPFTNAGPAPVAILDVSTSCGCTAASVAKTVVAPGETGAVAVRYTVGTGDGLQAQRISLLTDEAAENQYALTFQAELPRAVRAPLPPAAPVAPLFLHWSHRPFEAKAVTVDFAAAHASKFTATCTPAEAFTVRTVAEPGASRATIEVTPTEAAGRAPGELLVSLEAENGATQQHRVILRVLAGRQP